MDEAGTDEGAAVAGAAGAEETCPFCGSGLTGEQAARIAPNKGRMLQVTRTGGRKLFGKERKDIFLQWFAATGNLGIAAEKAGVARQTVSKHRLSDPEFEARYRDAVELCVPDLKARLIAHVQGRARLSLDGEIELTDEAAFDAQLAMQTLRELARMNQGEGSGLGRPRKTGRKPRLATNAEVKAALVRRLAAFGARLAKEARRDAGAPSLPAPGDAQDPDSLR